MLKRLETYTRRAPAAVAPKSFDAKARTFEAVVSTGAPVARRDGKGSYIEKLDLSAINPESLVGIAVLVEHRSGDPASHVGTVTAARYQGGELIAAIKITSDSSADSVIRKIEENILTSLSLGYSVAKWRETINNGQRVRTAVDWAVHEVSLVGIPADRNSKVRTAMAKPKKKEPVEDVIEETIIEDNPNERVQVRTQIRTLVRSAKLPNEFADNLIDMDATLDEAREAINERLQRRSQLASIRIQQVAPSGDDPAVVLTRSADALASRVMGTAPSDESKPYVNLRLVDHARNILDIRGETTRGMRDEEILTRAAQHTLSDFPNLLTGTGQRVLRAGYEAAPNVLKSLARKGTRTDFRAGTSLQLGEISKLEKVTESGELKAKTRGEAKESYALDTFGGTFSLSRKAIINDDLGAFRDWGIAAGKAASETEASQLLALLTANSGNGPTMHDGLTLFHANHGNLASPGNTIFGGASDLLPLRDARHDMRMQTGLDGKTPINATPKYLLVPAHMETEAEQALATIYAADATTVNPFSGRLTPLVDARLPDNAWYVFADPAILPVFEYAYLSGAEGPQVASREGWDVLGMEFRVILDFGAGAIDWRGAYRNPGE